MRPRIDPVVWSKIWWLALHNTLAKRTKEQLTAVMQDHPIKTRLSCLSQSQPPDHFHIHSATISVLSDVMWTHFSGFALDRHFNLIFLLSVFSFPVSQFAFIIISLGFLSAKSVNVMGRKYNPCNMENIERWLSNSLNIYLSLWVPVSHLN